MMFAESKETASGGIPENLFYKKSAEGARGIAPNLSGERTERAISMPTFIFRSCFF